VDDAALAVLHATATGAIASGPFSELRNNAVDGTVFSVAFLGLRKKRAGGGLLGRLPGDRACAGLEASATFFRAGAEITPAGYGTTNGAGARVAFTVLIVEHTTSKDAFCTTESGDVFHLAGSLLDALLASDAAVIPGGPVRHAAVDGACLGVAGAGLAKTGAGLAVVLGGSGDGTVTGTEASAA